MRSRRTAWLAARLRDLEPRELERLEAAIEPLAQLLGDVQQFTGGKGFADDVCLLGMEVAALEGGGALAGPGA